MASTADDVPPAEDTVVTRADEVTQHDGDWPVADLYLVEPEEEAVPADTGETVVMTATEAPPQKRRLPPIHGPGLLLAIAGTVCALILVAVLLGLRDDEPATSRPPETSSTPVQPPSSQPSSGDITVPDLQGALALEARSLLEKRGLRVRVNRLESDRPQGEVLTQQPVPGSKVAKGDLVALVVSKGAASQPAPPKSAPLPDVVGLTASDAVAAIRESGFEARLNMVTSSEPAGTVIRQSPKEASEVATGTTVVLEVAKSPPPAQQIDVPDVVGMTAAAARHALRSAGLAVSVVSVDSQEPAGTVISQSPGAGAELRKGSEVTIRVSSGPAKLDVPDVAGLDEESARLQLEDAGFQVRVTDESTSDPAEDGVVLRQSPAGGSTASEGTIVTLTVARLD